MKTHSTPTQENKSQAIANEVSQAAPEMEAVLDPVNARPEAILQRKLKNLANNSPQARQGKALHHIANSGPQVRYAAQLKAIANKKTSQQQLPVQRQENKTGLPDRLKTGMENLSAVSLNDVKVHRNSNKPAQLQAHAYAQGTDIHLGPGQERHLPHEAWHVVQQKQGRVKPTMQMKGKVNINDNTGLEKEADIMGVKALSFSNNTQKAPTQLKRPIGSNIAQLAVGDDLNAILGNGAYVEVTNNMHDSCKGEELLVEKGKSLLKAGVSAQQTKDLIKKIGKPAIELEQFTSLINGVVEMAGKSVPYTLFSPLLTNHLMGAPVDTINQYVNLTVFLHAWDYDNVNELIRAHGDVNPNNLLLGEWGSIASHFDDNDHATPTSFARTENWGFTAINELARAFKLNNPNGFTAANWIDLAKEVDNNKSADVIPLARIEGWNLGAILELTKAFKTNPNQLTGYDWASIAPALGANNHAETIKFARIPNWDNFRAICAFAKSSKKASSNPNGLTPDQWIELTGFFKKNHYADVIAFGGIPDKDYATIKTLATAYQGATTPVSMETAASTGEATDIGSSGMDVLTSALPTAAGESTDLAGDFMGDIATTPENISHVARMARLGPSGLVQDPTTAIQGTAGIAAIFSSFDTYGRIMSTVGDFSGMVELGTKISEYNPFIGLFGSGAKANKARNDKEKYSKIKQDLEALSAASQIQQVKDSASKMIGIADEKISDSSLNVYLNLADAGSGFFGPLVKGGVQVVTKSMGSSWGEWMKAKLADTNRFSEGMAVSYSVSKAIADEIANDLKKALEGFATPVVQQGTVEHIKTLYKNAKELGLEYFSKKIKEVAGTLPQGDAKRTAIEAL